MNHDQLQVVRKLPYMGYNGMCGPILVRNSILILANGVSFCTLRPVLNWISFFRKGGFFIIIDNTITKALHNVVSKQ